MTDLPDIDALLRDDWLAREIDKLVVTTRQRQCPHPRVVEVTAAGDPARTFLCGHCGVLLSAKACGL